MARVMVVVLAAMLFLGALAGSAECMNGCFPPPCPPPCPQRTIVTKMVPCVRTEMVAEVQPSTRMVPVKKIGYKIQNVMLKGTPIGCPLGQDPCTKCCPQPFCQVVQQKVPYVYYEPTCVPWYNVVYKPVCRPVMLPQQYMVEATPMCGY
jgi:hypothetical protein